MENTQFNKGKVPKVIIMAARTDILFASHMYQLIGGAERALYDEVVYLQKEGLNVHVIVGAEDSFSDALAKAGVPHTHIDLAWWARAPHDDLPYNYSHPDPTHSSMLKIIDLINDIRPRLCVTNTIVFPWMAYAAAFTNTPHAWQIHEMGHIHRLKYDIGEEQTFATINTLSNIVFYNSMTTAEYYTPYISQDKFGGIIYPIGSIEKPKAIAESPFKPESFKLVTVGQIKTQKRQLDTVKIVHGLRERGIQAEAAIIGILEDEPYVKEIKSYIKTHKLADSIHLLGYKDDPSVYVELADIAVLCAEKEAFGRVTVEAMLLGKPVVGAASGGTIEIIDDKKTGFLFEPGNINEAVDILALLYKDPTLCKQIGDAAKKQANEKFTQKSSYQPLLQYLETIKQTPQGAVFNLSPLSSITKDYVRLIEQNEELTSRIQVLETELSLIRNSKSWKVMAHARKLRHLGK
jgi:glycosyltransferase involved in cell wall biosynthesis